MLHSLLQYRVKNKIKKVQEIYSSCADIFRTDYPCLIQTFESKQSARQVSMKTSGSHLMYVYFIP